MNHCTCVWLYAHVKVTDKIQIICPVHSYYLRQTHKMKWAIMVPGRSKLTTVIPIPVPSPLIVEVFKHEQLRSSFRYTAISVDGPCARHWYTQSIIVTSSRIYTPDVNIKFNSSVDISLVCCRYFWIAETSDKATIDMNNKKTCSITTRICEEWWLYDSCIMVVEHVYYSCRIFVWLLYNSRLIKSWWQESLGLLYIVD